MKEAQLFNLISQQSDYIDQLEKSNLFLKYELGKFQTELKNVVEENEMLYKESQAISARTTMAESQRITQKTQNLLQNSKSCKLEASKTCNMSASNDQNGSGEKNNSWKAELRQIKLMYTTENEKLKQELLAAQKELIVERQAKSRLEKNDNNDLSNKDDKTTESRNKLHKKSKELMDELLSERTQLLTTIAGLNTTVSEYRSQEGILRKEVQKSFASLEEMQLENSQLKLEKSNLEESLKSINKKLEDTMDNTNRLIDESLKKSKADGSSQVLQLKKQVSELELSCSKLKLAHERSENQNSHLHSVVQEANEQLLLKEKALALLKSEALSGVQTTARANNAAETKLYDIKLGLERELQLEKQAKIMLEQKSLKLAARLEESQNEALKIQHVNVSLTDHVNRLQIQLKDKSKEQNNLQKNLSMQYDHLKMQSSKQFSQQAIGLDCLEQNYKLRLKEAENLSSKQAELIKKLKAECFDLENELSNLTCKYDKDISTLGQSNTELLLRAKNLIEKNEELTAQCVKHGLVHRNMKKHMTELNMNAQKSTSYMLDVLSKELAQR